MSIYSKTYERINWKNFPSRNTALDEINLNKMDKAIDEIDNRVVGLSGYEDIAKGYRDEAKSYAVGTNGEVREGDATDNAKYYSEVANLKSNETKGYRDETVSASESSIASARQALISETNAKNSEDNVTQIEQAVTSDKAEIEQAKADTLQAKSDAESAKSDAESASASAKSDAESIATAKDDVTKIKDDAVTIKGEIESLKSATETASQSASESASNASQSAEDAKHYAEQASQGVTKQAIETALGYIPISEDDIPTVDSELDSTSTNAIENKVVATAIEELDSNLSDLANRQGTSNPNLLDNGWFSINSRGQTLYNSTTEFMTVDRWKRNNRFSTITVTENGINYRVNADATSYANLDNVLTEELTAQLSNKTITLSVLLSDGTIYAKSYTMPNDLVNVRFDTDLPDDIIINGAYIDIYKRAELKALRVRIYCKIPETSLDIRAIKLELGDKSTLHLDTAPNDAEEQLRCWNSTADPNDPYANGYNPLISDAWVPRTWIAGEICISDNKLWECLVNNSNKPSEGTEWKKTSLGEKIKNVNDDIAKQKRINSQYKKFDVELNSEVLDKIEVSYLDARVIGNLCVFKGKFSLKKSINNPIITTNFMPHTVKELRGYELFFNKPSDAGGIMVNAAGAIQIYGRGSIGDYEFEIRYPYSICTNRLI